MIGYKQYVQQPDADQAFCARIWELGERDWKGAERVWRRLLGGLLDNIKGVESRAERRHEALKRAKKLVCPQ